MTRLIQNSDDGFAVTVEIKVDRVCTAFDRALRQGENPRVEDQLDGFEGEARDKLLASLLALEMDHQIAHGVPLSLADYRERFPNDIQVVKSVYVETVMPARIGRFNVEKILGKGGFGRVYLAYDETLKRHVAIKMLFSRGGRSDTCIQLLLHEARLAARLKHAAIVPVYEVGQDEDGDHFVVLEYVEGTTLGDARREYGLSELQVLEILIAVADALQYAHEQGLTHRDLKPANILVDRKHRPFITDFGLAVDESMQRLRAGEVAGTPPYMAPEQVAGETHRVDGRTDIWAFGVIFYELLTGSRPFSGDDRDELFFHIRHDDPKPPRQRDGTIPIRLERIVMTCLAKRMSDRYRSAADLAAALRIAHREFASDRRMFLSGVSDPSAASTHKAAVPALPRVVPKGLRSFERKDAASFLRLLPGPRDSDGLPEPIRFWQERINDTDEDSTFSIGLLYGPSGCGKSSFVKAGLLPRLADHVVPVFIESTGDETELRLLKAIRKVFGDIPNDLALPDIIAGIREGRWVVAGKKLLIVLDQFEQWLHANTVQVAAQLTDALRQCDGGRVQAIMLVRDDFWMQVTRLLHVLEVPLLEGRNSAAVDLFDVRHAAAVLGEFGIAYGKLPAKIDDWSDEQRRFIELAASNLAVDGRVVPVRLALFVEMIKLRSWTAETMVELGGAQGTGVAFLEETFHGRSAAPERRLYRDAARAVLECLLPPEGTDIRGNMRPERELLECSGYANSPDDFARLVTILDSELRLITPTDPAGQSHESDRSASAMQSAEHFYQLTHDYLVPAIRTWLTRSKRATVRGRAELRLSERGAAYQSQRHVRQLPSTWEWISILALTRKRNYKENERRLMRAANRHHLWRLAAAAVVVVLATWIAIEASGRLRANGFMRSLATAATADVPQLVRDISPLRRWMDPQLRQAFLDGRDKERLHAAMALLPIDDGLLDYLVEQLLVADADTIGPIRQTVSLYGDRDATEGILWKHLGETNEVPSRRLRAAIGLAQIGASDDPRWEAVSGDVFEAWIDDVVANPSNFDRWLQMLRPIGKVMEQPALAAFADTNQDSQTRYVVAAILAGLRANQPDKLVELLVDADREQFRPLESALLHHSDAALPLLRAVASQPSPSNVSEVEKDIVVGRQANAAVCLFELGQSEALADALASVKHGDRRLQTWTISRFSRASASESSFRSHLEGALALLQHDASGAPTESDEIVYGSTLIVGNLAEQPWSQEYASRRQIACWIVSIAPRRRRALSGGMGPSKMERRRRSKRPSRLALWKKRKRRWRVVRRFRVSYDGDRRGARQVYGRLTQRRAGTGVG